MVDLVIGLDCSTTACKAIAWDAEGHSVAQGRRGLELLMPRPGWHEQDAEAWWEATTAALREVAAQIDIRRVAGFCIAHQRETFVPVDRLGRPLCNALVWMDERSRPLLPELERRLGAARFHRLTGKPLSGNLAVGKIAWLAQYAPAVFRATRFYLDVHAFLAGRLTGRYVTGWGSADPLGLFDMERRCWAEEVLREIGVRPEQMPELAPPGVVIGKLTTDAATACGLPAGLPVVCGLGDGQAAGLGAGITQPGLTYLNLGTAVVSGTCTATYLVDRAFRTTCSGIPGTYFLETVLLGGTYTVMWFIERCGTEFPASSFQPPTTAEEAWEQAIANLPPGADGLLLVPYWNSAMNPYWDAAASGIVVGWRGTHDRRHFYRAILEGIAFEQRLHTEGVEAATRQRVKGFVAMGGGSSSPLWCQIVADVTGKLVYRCETAEASALGAGILAAGAVGIHRGTVEAAAAMTRIAPQPFEPDAGRHAIYTRLYEEVYRHLFPALQRYLDRLAELTQET